MNEILKDHTKFSEIKEDHFRTIIKQEDKINRLLTKMKSKKEIPGEVYSSLHSSGSRPGILYGLPKVHKSGAPLRPILSAIGTAGYNLAKFLLPIIKPITLNRYTVQDSFTFAQEIQNYPDSSNYIMASFDVKSLFTNLPLDETIQIATDCLYSDPVTSPAFSCTFFKQLLEFAVKNVLFLFNGKLFSQFDGIGMGNPLGPTLANVFLCFHETKWLNDCPLEFKPKFFRRYIDDIFLLFSDQNQILPFLNYLNSKHNNIKFTCESEINNSLSFLEINISRNNNKFDTSVFFEKRHSQAWDSDTIHSFLHLIEII